MCYFRSLKIGLIFYFFIYIEMFNKQGYIDLDITIPDYMWLFSKQMTFV